MIDFAEPGALGMFTDRGTVAKLERKMEREGCLEGATWPARSTCCAPTT